MVLGENMLPFATSIFFARRYFISLVTAAGNKVRIRARTSHHEYYIYGAVLAWHKRYENVNHPKALLAGFNENISIHLQLQYIYVLFRQRPFKNYCNFIIII